MPEGVLPAGEGFSLPRGFSLPGGSPCPGGFSLPGGSPCWGSSLPEIPPVDRITDTSKNITLATTSLRLVNILSGIWVIYFWLVRFLRCCGTFSPNNMAKTRVRRSNSAINVTSYTAPVMFCTGRKYLRLGCYNFSVLAH